MRSGGFLVNLRVCRSFYIFRTSLKVGEFGGCNVDALSLEKIFEVSNAEGLLGYISADYWRLSSWYVPNEVNLTCIYLELGISAILP